MTPRVVEVGRMKWLTPRRYADEREAETARLTAAAAQRPTDEKIGSKAGVRRKATPGSPRARATSYARPRRHGEARTACDAPERWSAACPAAPAASPAASA